VLAVIAAVAVVAIAGMMAHSEWRAYQTRQARQAAQHAEYVKERCLSYSKELLRSDLSEATRQVTSTLKDLNCTEYDKLLQARTKELVDQLVGSGLEAEQKPGEAAKP
jgi:hypothetical protein